jgi:hypothetical protein
MIHPNAHGESRFKANLGVNQGCFQTLFGPAHCVSIDADKGTVTWCLRKEGKTMGSLIHAGNHRKTDMQ